MFMKRKIGRHFAMEYGMGHNLGQSHDGVVHGVYPLNRP